MLRFVRNTRILKLDHVWVTSAERVFSKSSGDWCQRWPEVELFWCFFTLPQLWPPLISVLSNGSLPNLLNYKSLLWRLDSPILVEIAQLTGRPGGFEKPAIFAHFAGLAGLQIWWQIMKFQAISVVVTFYRISKFHRVWKWQPFEIALFWGKMGKIVIFPKNTKFKRP